ncbi:YidH family protein [Micromonospora echinospora]|uniref:YidH family protein n=1 Tax=Micromonospora echinospora TaxID=1877 RepID=UPI003A84CEED
MRREPAWYREGSEPDYRFTLANERTFLAWVRTALALLAGAVAVVHVLPTAALPGVRTAVAVLLAATATVLPWAAYQRWARVQRAMRLGRDLPFTRSLALVAVLLGVLGAGVVVLVLAT